MRLLNTKTGKFQQFESQQTPAYAIVSHRWGKHEVSYEEYRSGKAKPGPGLRKIQQASKIARGAGYEWIWIDTCCIDKKNNTELQAAINSMWRWYRDAAICYAYLDDVPVLRSGRGAVYDPAQRRWRLSPKAFAALRRSVWFTRGWTLQELLAPRTVAFYNDAWEYIGTKARLAPYVAAITGIGTRYLTASGPLALSSASVAMKMSWAARRRTTVLEDQAYCLLGLFGVHMPLLYGEGREAFMSLQRAIIARSDDESIFAWHADSTTAGKGMGMLAPSPTAFRHSGRVMNFRLPADQRLPYSMTNQGLELRLPSLKTRPVDSPEDQCGYEPFRLQMPKNRQTKEVQLACGFVADANSPSERQARRAVISIRLSRVHGEWQRVECGRIITHDHYVERWGGLHTVFYVPQPAVE